jgi:peptidoglycan/LPS O-acetylase OafA/YrhL
MKTLGQCFESSQNNFTLLRLLAAIAVLYYHCYPLSLGRGAHDPISEILIRKASIGLGGLSVGAFFLVSGFLVTSSYINRSSIFAFIESRVLRIFPALIVAVLFCAFIIGPLVTSLDLHGYISNERVWRYILKNSIMVTGIQYDLPGVFLDNPWKIGVNGSLWTLPVEVWMYMWVSVVGAFGILKKRAVFNAVVFVSFLIYCSSPDSFLITKVDGSVRNPLFFVIGAFFFVNRDYIPINTVALLVLTACVILFRNSEYGFFLYTLYISYFIFYIAFLEALNKFNPDKIGDLSYGVYIFAFPVQQVAANYITGISPVSMMAVTLPVVLCLAYFSWTFVERPALRLKGRMPLGKRFLDPRVLNRRQS